MSFHCLLSANWGLSRKVDEMLRKINYLLTFPYCLFFTWFLYFSIFRWSRKFRWHDRIRSICGWKLSEEKYDIASRESAQLLNKARNTAGTRRRKTRWATTNATAIIIDGGVDRLCLAFSRKTAHATQLVAPFIDFLDGFEHSRYSDGNTS